MAIKCAAKKLHSPFKKALNTSTLNYKKYILLIINKRDNRNDKIQVYGQEKEKSLKSKNYNNKNIPVQDNRMNI